jgi:hypothetical protein
MLHKNKAGSERRRLGPIEAVARGRPLVVRLSRTINYALREWFDELERHMLMRLRKAWWLRVALCGPSSFVFRPLSHRRAGSWYCSISGVVVLHYLIR